MTDVSKLPAKPAFGAPCNGCGVCCQLERCHFSVEILGAGPGPCPALENGEGRTWCGLLKNPPKYMGDASFLISGVRVGDFQVAFAHALAIGSGCDSSDEAVIHFKRAAPQASGDRSGS